MAIVETDGEYRIIHVPAQYGGSYYKLLYCGTLIFTATDLAAIVAKKNNHKSHRVSVAFSYAG